MSKSKRNVVAHRAAQADIRRLVLLSAGRGRSIADSCISESVSVQTVGKRVSLVTAPGPAGAKDFQELSFSLSEMPQACSRYTNRPCHPNC